MALTPTLALGVATTAPTQAANDNSTKVATTAYVDAAVAGVSGSGGVAATAPNTITGIYRWFKSDTGVTMNGSNQVSAWADQSGLVGGNATQATTSKMPVYTASVLDGFGSLRFTSASSQELNFLLSGIVGTAYTIMVVAARRADPGGYLIGAVSGGTTNGSLHLGWTGSSAWGFRHWSNDFDTTIEPYVANRFHCFFCLLNTTNGRKTEAFDGSTTGTISSTATLGSIPGGGAIGQAVGTYGNYDLMEVAIWTAALTKAQRDGVRAYVKARYPSAVLATW